MIEQAFIVNKSAPLYKSHFMAVAERQKFHVLARSFFDKYAFVQEEGKTGYYIAEDLRMQLAESDREKYASQLTKLIDKNDLSYFKRNSKMNKAWQKEVVSLCDFKVIEGTWCWYFPYIGQGSYALWHSGNVLYGYLSDKNKTTLDLPEWMEPIKMSEYYAVQEELANATSV